MNSAPKRMNKPAAPSNAAARPRAAWTTLRVVTTKSADRAVKPARIQKAICRTITDALSGTADLVEDGFQHRDEVDGVGRGRIAAVLKLGELLEAATVDGADAI